MPEDNQNQNDDANKGGADDANNADANKGGGDGGGDKGKQGGGDSDANKSLIDLDGKGDDKKGERPAYIPESLWDKDKKAVKDGTDPVVLKELETAHKRVDGLRKELGKAPQKAPAKPEDYKLPDFTKDEKDAPLKDVFKPDDPFVKGMAPVFHKHGVSQAQYEGIMRDGGHLLAGLAKDIVGDASQPPTAEELEEHRNEQYKAIGPNAPRLAAAVSEHFRMLKEQGHFTDNELEEIKATTASAHGLTMMNKLRVLMGGESIPMGDTLTVDGLKSDAEIQGMIGSDEYMNPSNPKHAEMQRTVKAQLTLREKAGRPERLQV